MSRSRWVDELRAAAGAQERFLNFLLRFEKLASLPTRFSTGHFVIVRAAR
ncbi:MAG TPA: hypothetical protein VGQ52_13955 [Gemmatimonadaceae bacterium]|nr:hypothetical protein [Gemmatimonadaceae bacterium]